jgi:hypothetical protein
LSLSFRHVCSTSCNRSLCGASSVRYLTYDDSTEYVSWLHHEAEVVRDSAESVVRGAVEADPDDEYLVGLAGPWEAATPTFCQSTATCSTSRIVPSKTARGASWPVS